MKAVLRSAEIDSRSGLISLLWADGLRRVFHPLWLRDQCPSIRHPGTKQRLSSSAELPQELRATGVEASDQVLRVQWKPAHDSAFCAAWLRSHGSDEATLAQAPPNPFKPCARLWPSP